MTTSNTMSIEEAHQSNALQPISRMPAELFMRTVHYAQQGWPYNSQRLFDLLLLSHVCHNWMRTIRDTATFWCEIVISSATVKLYPLFLSRSRNLPLRIYVHAEEMNVSGKADLGLKAMRHLLGLIPHGPHHAPTRDRIKLLAVRSPNHDQLQVLHALTRSLSALDHLEITLDSEFADDLDTPPEQIQQAHELPALLCESPRSFKLQNCVPTWTSLDMSTLSTLDLMFSLSAEALLPLVPRLSAFAALMASCTCLQTLRITNAFPRPDEDPRALENAPHFVVHQTVFLDSDLVDDVSDQIALWHLIDYPVTADVTLHIEDEHEQLADVAKRLFDVTGPGISLTSLQLSQWEARASYTTPEGVVITRELRHSGATDLHTSTGMYNQPIIGPDTVRDIRMLSHLALQDVSLCSSDSPLLPLASQSRSSVHLDLREASNVHTLELALGLDPSILHRLNQVDDAGNNVLFPNLHALTFIWPPVNMKEQDVLALNAAILVFLTSRRDGGCGIDTVHFNGVHVSKLPLLSNIQEKLRDPVVIEAWEPTDEEVQSGEDYSDEDM